MKTLFSISIFLLLALVTGTLTNSRLISKIKSSQTSTELNFSKQEAENILDLNSLPAEHKQLVLSPAGQDNLHYKFTLLETNECKNPALNLLYLAHSPPALS